MKKIIIAFAALSLVLGCTKEIEQKSGQTVERVFTASFDEPSKTSLDASGKVDWCKNDAISYYTASEGAISSVTVPEDSHSFTFTATVGVDDSFIVAAYGGTISTPQGKSMTLTSNAAGAEQSGKFEDAHVSVCKRYFENGNTLSFKGITSLIKFSLSRTDIAYVTFTADDGTKIHGNGKISFTFSGETISYSFGQEDGGSTIKINTDGAGTFFIASLPCSINGFTLKYFDSSDKLIGSTTSTKTLSIGSKKIVDLGTLDSRIEDVPPVDLSANGTANCYIASVSGVNYKFKATVKGGSTESVGSVKKAKVLWESFGTDVTPNIGDVISNVSMKGDYVKFTSGQNGNAVIAVVDADGDILWSWHIWVCNGFDPDVTAQVYNNNAGTMMDRNLGATSATPGDVHALGLLYQWGRKDPFLSGCQISYSAWQDNQQAASTLSWPSPVSSDSNNGTIAYTVAHPMTFITYNDYNFDWYYTGSSSTDNTRWQISDNDKGMYDPCPAGWCVPDGGSSGVWSTAFGSSSWYENGPWDSTHYGMDFGSGNGTSSCMQLGSASTICYPAAGYRSYDDGSLCDVGYHGLYLSCTPDGYIAFYFGFNCYGSVGPSLSSSRAYGRSVRCVKEGTQPSQQITDLSANGTANCYIVSEAGKYKIKAVKGNTATSVGEVKGVKVLWESFGTDVTPTVGDIIKSDVSYSDGYITFSTNSTFTEGNAVIAAYCDAACTDGNVLWSWHIWCTDKPEEQVYNNNAGTMMDRNLGATSTIPGDVHTLGLLYQWGRKDPFLGSSSISSSNIAKATICWPNHKTAAETSTINYSRQYPSTYMLQNETNHDWLYSNNNAGDWKRWHNGSKSVYDPCPNGWRVPDGGNSGVYLLAFAGIKSVQDQQSWNAELCCFNFSAYLASSVYYPAAGVIGNDGTIINTGKDGNYWTSDVASLFDFHSSGSITTNIINNAHYGRSVRCMKDIPTPEVVSAREIVLNSTSKTFYITPGGGGLKQTQLTASVLPVDTSDKTVVWSSTDTSVATVSQSGLVNVVCTWGGCDIVATCGNASAKCEISVIYWN